MEYVNWEEVAKEARWIQKAWDLCRSREYTLNCGDTIQEYAPIGANMTQLKQLYRDGLTPFDAVNKLIGVNHES